MDFFPNSQSPPSFDDAPRLLAGIAQIVLDDHPAHDDLFQVELTLRALLPVLEETLRQRIWAEGDFDGVREADAALTELATTLGWLELEGQASWEDVHAWLRGGVTDAEHAVRFLI